MPSCVLLGNLDAGGGAHKTSCGHKHELKKMFSLSLLYKLKMKINTYLTMPFLFHCHLERHVVSSVFYIPGTYHPSISYLSPRWRSPVSSGEASPGNLFTVAGKEKWHVEDQKWKWIKQHTKIKEWKFTQEWKRFCHQGNHSGLLSLWLYPSFLQVQLFASVS